MAVLGTLLLTGGGRYRARLHLSVLDELPTILTRLLTASAAVASGVLTTGANDSFQPSRPVTGAEAIDALTKIADHQPDIIFVDIMMPRLDGYQTCALIKHNKVFRSIPVIMLSSKDGLFDRARGRIVGSEHYLTKPFTKDELLSAIETHIGR